MTGTSKIRNTNNGHISFLCPACGFHHAIPVDGTRGWSWNGDPNSPTITPSILARYHHSVPPVTPENLAEYKRSPWPQTQVDAVCHSFVTNGRIQYCGDSTHALAGQTVDLPEIGDST